MASTRTCPIRSTRSSTTAGFPARESSRSPPASRSAGRSATKARGGSRGSRKSWATFPSSQSSTGHTKPPRRNSAPVSRERESERRPQMSSDQQAQGLDKARLSWILTQMVRIREFEERVKHTFEEHPGAIRGHTHLADGAEASIVGSLATLRSGDQVLATYRCHGYPLALGSAAKAMMAEIYGKKTGICGGYGGSMHLVD